MKTSTDYIDEIAVSTLKILVKEQAATLKGFGTVNSPVRKGILLELARLSYDIAHAMEKEKHYFHKG